MDKTTEVKDAKTTEVKPTEVKPAVEAPKVDPPAPETKVVDAKVADQTTITPPPAESIEDFVTRVLDTKEEISDADLDKLYEHMLDAMKEEGFTEKEIADAKLSSDKRKKLAKSSFCGPDKSFPVPDCAHVTAARRLIGKYKGSGSKESILSCVSRKAKAMGCEGKSKTKDSVKDNHNHINVLQQLLQVLSSNQWASEESKPLDDKDLGVLQGLIEKLAKVVTEDSFVKATSALPGFKLIQDTQLLEEIEKLEDSLGKIRDELKSEKETVTALREEMELTSKEAQTLQDNLLESKSKLKEVKVKRLELLKTLKEGKPVTISDGMSLADATLDNELESLAKEVDINKITDKLSDGTARVPQGEVTNPGAVNLADSINVEDVKKELAWVRDTYTQMSFRNKPQAEAWREAQIERLRREGKLPVEGK